MQPRRLRLGDILDDYCPRERRITNHAVVAMIDDDVKQTRCTTCDAEHEYREARAPVLRRRKAATRPGPDGAAIGPADPAPGAGPIESPPVLADAMAGPPPSADAGHAPVEVQSAEEPDADQSLDEDPAPDDGRVPDDEGPVHRRLIRATLPRPEGQVPERKAPDFTSHQPAGRGREAPHNKRGGRHRNRRGPAHPGAPGNAMPRVGGSQGPRDGNRQPRPHTGPRAGQPAGQGRGPRPATGRGPKRGR